MPRSVNRTFTKPETRRSLVSTPNSFEQIVKELNISPGEYRRSPELKEWVRRYKDVKIRTAGITEGIRILGGRLVVGESADKWTAMPESLRIRA
jgi:hypothetical protein